MKKISLPSNQTSFTDEQLEEQKLSMWSCLANQITPSVNSVVEFAKRVPSKSAWMYLLQQQTSLSTTICSNFIVQLDCTDSILKHLYLPKSGPVMGLY